MQTRQEQAADGVRLAIFEASEAGVGIPEIRREIDSAAAAVAETELDREEPATNDTSHGRRVMTHRADAGLLAACKAAVKDIGADSDGITDATCALLREAIRSAESAELDPRDVMLARVSDAVEKIDAKASSIQKTMRHTAFRGVDIELEEVLGELYELRIAVNDLLERLHPGDADAERLMQSARASASDGELKSRLWDEALTAAGEVCDFGGVTVSNPVVTTIRQLATRARTAEDASQTVAIRDFFAGLAMQAMCCGPGAVQVANRDGRYDETNWDFIVASNAFSFADAMLAERERRLGLHRPAPPATGATPGGASPSGTTDGTRAKEVSHESVNASG
jgi:hypothetical protein